MDSNTKDFLADFSDKLEDKILPYCSGINNDWDISYSNDAKIIHCSNLYDHMNKDGLYDATIPFSLDIPVNHPLDFDIRFTGDEANRLFAEEDNLSLFLEDIVALALNEHKIEFQNFAQIISSHAINLKEDVIMEGMKIFSENRPRSEKEASSIRNYLEKQFDATDKSPEAFLYEIKENAFAACKSLNIAPPVHTWDDFEYAGSLTAGTISLNVSKNKNKPCWKSIYAEQNDYGYASVKYRVERAKNVIVPTKCKFYAYGKLIGEIQCRQDDEPPKEERFIIYGHGFMQDLLKKEFDHLNDKHAYANELMTVISYEPESKELFQGVHHLIDDFNQSGGKEIHYAPSREIKNSL